MPPPPTALARHHIVGTQSDWSAIVADAETRLQERGVDPATVSMDDLIDGRELERLERRSAGGFSLKTHLDCYDVAAAVAAGLTAACADFLIVRIPRDILYLGQHHQEGSALTGWLRSIEIPTDNWLARHFRTSFDHVGGIGTVVSGFGPQTHRLQTFGHDPLVGLVIGTIDIMRGGLTAISKCGEITRIGGTGLAEYNPLVALVREVMHLLSDGFTPMGLPAPGWSLLQLFEVGSFGEKERTMADLARFMYLKGYDSRHFLTMSSSVAAAEVVLRGYFTIRQRLDEEYAEAVTREQEEVGSVGTGAHPRFQSMALAAHGLASAANAGKVTIYGGNPLAINYAQWLRFIQSIFACVPRHFRSPSDCLQGQVSANFSALADGWPAWNTHSPVFPSLRIGG